MFATRRAGGWRGSRAEAGLGCEDNEGQRPLHLHLHSGPTPVAEQGWTVQAPTKTGPATPGTFRTLL